MSNNKKGYETGRRNDGKKRKIGLLTCRRITRMLALKLGLRRTDAERLATAMVCMIIKMQHRMSYRELASHLEMHSDMLRMCRLKKAPSKSKLHTMSEMIVAT